MSPPSPGRWLPGGSVAEAPLRSVCTEGEATQLMADLRDLQLAGRLPIALATVHEAAKKAQRDLADKARRDTAEKKPAFLSPRRMALNAAQRRADAAKDKAAKKTSAPAPSRSPTAFFRKRATMQVNCMDPRVWN